MRLDKPGPVWPLLVFYDGGCPVCRREMLHYRGLAHGGRLEFVDIAAPDFRAEDFGRSIQQFREQMHVQDAAGRFWTAVDAFCRIWAALPGRRYRWLAWCVSRPGIHALAGLGYRLFARYRHLLAKGDKACTDERCAR